MLFLIFGFLKTSFGLIASLTALAHSIMSYELYLNRNFDLALFVLVGIVKLLIVVRHRMEEKRDWLFWLLSGAAALAFSGYVSDYGVGWSGNLTVLTVGCLMYAFPMGFFFLHLRSTFYLIYQKVLSKDDVEGVLEDQVRR